MVLLPGEMNSLYNGRVQEGEGKMHHMTRTLQCSVVSLLAVTLALEFCAPARAAVLTPQEPGDVGKSQAELNGYSEARWAELMDNTLNYEEIPDLVHNFNPAITSAWSNLNDSIDLMDTIVDNLKSRQREMADLKQDAQASKDYGNYGYFYMQEMILQKASNTLADSTDKLRRPVTASNRPLRVAERQAASGAKQLMIAYNALLRQRAIVAESVQMYEKLFQDTQLMQVQGLATATDVLKVQSSLLSSQSTLATIDTNLIQLKENLILLCGWKAGADPVIGETPAADLSRINAMDPEADLTRAIANNGSIIDFHHEKHYHSSTAMEARDATEAEMYQNLLTNLKQQYQTILADKAAYEGAVSGLQAAEMTKNAADVQYRLGMLSAANYLGALTQYQQARTQMDTADSTLFQAMETYDWMLAGNASVE